MAGITLDSAGTEKMKTLDEALVQAQRLHGIVEGYALALKQNKPTTLYGMQVKRALFPIIGLLKPQFALIADQVAAVNLVTSRGGSETVKVRILREAVGALKQALEIAVVRVKSNHAVEDEAPSAE